MNDTANSAVSNGMAAGTVLLLLVVGLALYVFFCFCAKRICEKCGVTPGVLIWIPIAQIVPLLQVAQMPIWTIILFLIPIVSIIVSIVMWVKICQARGKGALAIVSVILLPFIGIPYLAFSE